MEKLYKIPLLFFLIAACMGLLLRSQMIFPLEAITFSFLLHGHSHVMFLGWVFNTLYIAYVTQFIEGDQKLFKVIFWILQILVVGMLISFPLQGYGSYSIVLSTLHTVVVFIFTAVFLRRTRTHTRLSVWLARVSLLFFILSSIGPFSLGYLKANHLDHTNLYRFAIYFYLHFQYNGFFFLGVLSLLMSLIETKISLLQLRQIKISCWFFIIACLPAYVLSTLWATPGLAYNIIGGLAGILQLAAVVILSGVTIKFLTEKPRFLKPPFKFLLRFTFAALILKVCLQLLSAHQEIANMIDENRPIIVGYLHLMLVGVISLFLVGWLIQKRIIGSGGSVWANRLFLIGFIGSEVILFTSPWTSVIPDIDPVNLQVSILSFSVLMVLAVVMYFKAAFWHR